MAKPPDTTDTVSISHKSINPVSYLCLALAEQTLFHQVLQRSLLLHVRKNCLLPPLSSITSTSPGFNCSIEGTWLARTPISPDSAGMLTWTLTIGMRISPGTWSKGGIAESSRGPRTHLWTCISTIWENGVSTRSVTDKCDGEVEHQCFRRKINTYLMGKGQGEFDFVRYCIGISSSLAR